ncbi:hypothetical protein FRB93_012147 [Tulasnella sp. JGI-2019a]|nr:hypothetical protein FRB93_012147 [Tulasnella sp. JGI-2019a]
MNRNLKKSDKGQIKELQDLGSGMGSSTAPAGGQRGRHSRHDAMQPRRRPSSGFSMNKISGRVAENNLRKSSKLPSTISSRGPDDILSSNFNDAALHADRPFQSSYDNDSRNGMNPFSRPGPSSSPPAKRQKVEHTRILEDGTGVESIPDSNGSRSSTPDIELLEPPPSNSSNKISKLANDLHARVSSHQNGDPGPGSAAFRRRRSSTPEGALLAGPSDTARNQQGDSDKVGQGGFHEGKSLDSLDPSYIDTPWPGLSKVQGDSIETLLNGADSSAPPSPSRYHRSSPRLHPKPVTTATERMRQRGTNLTTPSRSQFPNSVLQPELGLHPTVQGKNASRHRHSAPDMSTHTSSSYRTKPEYNNISDDEGDAGEPPTPPDLPPSFPLPSIPDSVQLSHPHQGTVRLDLLSASDLQPDFPASRGLTSHPQHPVRHQQQNSRPFGSPTSASVPLLLKTYQRNVSTQPVGPQPEQEKEDMIIHSASFPQRPDVGSHLPEMPEHKPPMSSPGSASAVSSPDVVEIPRPSSPTAPAAPTVPDREENPMETDPIIDSSQEQGLEPATPSEHRYIRESAVRGTHSTVGSFQVAVTASENHTGRVVGTTVNRELISFSRPTIARPRALATAPTLTLQYNGGANEKRKENTLLNGSEKTKEPRPNGSGPGAVREHIKRIEAGNASSSRNLPSSDYGSLASSSRNPAVPRSVIPPPTSVATKIVPPGQVQKERISKSMGLKAPVSINKSVQPPGGQKIDCTPPTSQLSIAQSLPLRRWFWGRRQIVDAPGEQDGRPQWWVRWTDNVLSVYLWKNLQKLPDITSSELSVMTPALNAFQHAPPDDDPVVLKLEINGSMGLKPWLQPEQDYLIFEFDSHATGFTSDGFRKMINILSKSDAKGSRLTTRAARSLLEMAENDAALLDDQDFPVISSRQPSPTHKGEKQKEASSAARRSSEDEVEGRVTDSSASNIDDLHMVPDSTLRRSTRRVHSTGPPPVSIDNNELLFSYAPVNITKGDLARLEPGEFLNDTLIEFGLKIWANDLIERHPDIAKDVWIFNSFFYKKLNHKNPEEGYNSVRKWTSKTDIFQKKFIIVPINERYHWYLAVIYNPRFTLTPPRAPVPKTTRASVRKADRTAIEQVITAVPNHDSTSTSETEMAEQNEVDTSLLVQPGDEACISPTADRASPRPRRRRSPSLDADGDTSMSVTEESSNNHLYPQAASPPIQVKTESNVTPDWEVNNARGTATKPFMVESQDDIKVPQSDDNMSISDTLESITLDAKADQDDLGTAALTGNDFERPEHSVPPNDNIPADIGELALEKSPQNVMIYIMDSLGGKHPSVVKALKRWLKAEAVDKKGVIESTEAQASYVHVPYQPNHFDCGVYLLHFAETFVQKHEEVWRWMQIKKNRDAKARDEMWGKDQLKSKRAALKHRVQALADEWKTSKAIESLSDKGKGLPISSDPQITSPPLRNSKSRLQVPRATSSEPPSSTSEPASLSSRNSPSEDGNQGPLGGSFLPPIRDDLDEVRPAKALIRKTPVPERLRLDDRDEDIRGSEDCSAPVPPPQPPSTADSDSEVEIMGEKKFTAPTKRAPAKEKASGRGRKAAIKPPPATGSASRLR